jgi:effector-binding domain-containing protein
MITAPELTTTTEQPAATIHLVIPGRDMPKHMDPAIQEILKVLADQGLQPAGPMFSYHHRRPSDTFDFEIGFPVAQAIDEQGRVKSGSLPAERVARCIYQGPYERLSEAWPKLQEWVREQDLPETGRFFERYLNNPDEVQDPLQYHTELNWILSEA